MARIRSIKPEFWTDEKVVEMTPLARLLFIGLWNYCDDYGRMPYSPMRIKLQVLPLESTDISELLGEIRRRSLIQVYSVDGKDFLQVVNFEKHQKVDHRTESKIPPPTEAPPNSTDDSRKIALDRNGMEGIKERKGKETTTAADRKNPDRQPKSNGARIEFDQVKGCFAGITEDQELQWQEAFPAVPIPPAIQRAAAWAQANPANRKSNWKRFLVNWFSREQDRAARVRK